MRPKNTIEDIWKYVNKTDSCWLWTGTLDKDGYGAWWLEGKLFRAHRAMMELAGRAIPPNLVSRHLCNVRNCVNPKHIVAGTVKENVHDQLVLGTHSRLKYSKEIVNKIRAEYESKQVSQRSLARKYGISPSHVNEILRNTSRVVGV